MEIPYLNLMTSASQSAGKTLHPHKAAEPRTRINLQFKFKLKRD